MTNRTNFPESTWKNGHNNLAPYNKSKKEKQKKGREQKATNVWMNRDVLHALVRIKILTLSRMSLAFTHTHRRTCSLHMHLKNLLTLLPLMKNINNQFYSTLIFRYRTIAHLSAKANCSCTQFSLFSSFFNCSICLIVTDSNIYTFICIRAITLRMCTCAYRMNRNRMISMVKCPFIRVRIQVV